MAFPIDNHGEIKWINLRALNAADFKQHLLTKAFEELKAANGYNIEIQGNRISFRGGMFRFVSNWNILTQIDKGYIEIAPSSEGLTVSYYISFRQLSTPTYLE
ncbi:MAG: hypothetical protein ACR2LC_08440 [Pyrinomonadaceae bacterium]